MLKRKSPNPNPNPNPNAPIYQKQIRVRIRVNYTIFQKHCHDIYLKQSYPKQLNKKLKVCTPTLPQSKELCNALQYHSKSNIGILGNLQLNDIK